MNTCRSRNVPKAVARNGTARPWYVFSQPSESTVRRLTTSVVSSGTSSVARNTTNNRPRPGKSIIANAYAESNAVASWAMVMTVATTNELRRYLSRWPSVHASENPSSVNGPGTSGCWSTSLPGLRAPITVVYTGNNTTTATPARSR